ncbi:hypothetical protein H206_02234 [Candidatus Electrothrix aarhusensis]|uniref:Amino-acid N-acetyltransferase n=1 Tax=Candidatus Electrothrix aarhusensis TaxID=1859131 RepID=A0A444ITR6_9BACT|nr:hypothetical protein H206_02234 [Candidatus Electrothrix aarhusensis]
MKISIRPARMGDVKDIHSLLQQFANKGVLLGRSISSLYDQLRDFVVFDDNGIQASAPSISAGKIWQRYDRWQSQISTRARESAGNWYIPALMRLGAWR